MTLISACNPAVQNASCNYDVGSNNFFKGQVVYDQYGYNVERTVAYVFVALFGVSTLLHFGQAIWSRHYWLLYTLFLFTAGECLGWVGRLWSATSTVWLPDEGGAWANNFTAFQIQICCLIISPAFAAAANYLLLKRLAPILGHEYFIVHPVSYTAVFIAGDILSLVVQAAGGGIASAATTLAGANNGAYIMVGGVFIQIVVMIGYTVILASFIYRMNAEKPVHKPLELFKWWPNGLRPKSNKRGYAANGGREAAITRTPSSEEMKEMDSNPITVQSEQGYGYSTKQHRGAKILLVACCVSNALIFARSIYRSIELLGGWRGRIIEDQILFNIMDAMLMLMVAFLYNILHPGFFLRSAPRSS